MTSIYQSMKSYLYKPSADKKTTENPVNNPASLDNPSPTDNPSQLDDVKENDAPELRADKKTDENIDPSTQPGMVWRLSSGLYSTATGAVNMGVGGVKWVAGKGYNAGKAVVNKVPSVPRLQRKDKNE